MDQDFISNYIALKDGIIKNRSTGKIIKPYKMKNGYLQVTLYDLHGNHKKFLIHRLVAAQHIPNPHHYTTVNHKNFIRTDNRADNLEWMSMTDNLRHAREYGENIYTKERNEKIRRAKTGIPRSEETKRKLSKYWREKLTDGEKTALTHRLHKHKPSKACPLCLSDD